MFDRLLGGDSTKAIQQYAQYDGMFSNNSVRKTASYMPAWQWWRTSGSHLPDLQHVAVRVLAQPSSASACERSWSTFEFIHNKKRNKLQPERAEKLVYIFINLRLVLKATASDMPQPAVEWCTHSSEACMNTKTSLVKCQSGA